MKPDPAAVRKAADAWYDAASALNASTRVLKRAYIAAGMYWEGDAYEGFKLHMTEQVIYAAGENEKTLRAIGDALIETHDKIVEKYNEGHAELSLTIKEAIAYHRDLETQNGDARSATWNALHSYLNLWLANSIKRRGTVYGILNKRAGEISKLHGTIKSLKLPGAVPDGIKDSKKWKQK
ncbi:WXG100 family type VII secretion target [Spirillospora sp. NPDC127200]